MKKDDLAISAARKEDELGLELGRGDNHGKWDKEF